MVTKGIEITSTEPPEIDEIETTPIENKITPIETTAKDHIEIGSPL